VRRQNDFVKLKFCASVAGYGNYGDGSTLPDDFFEHRFLKMCAEKESAIPNLRYMNVITREELGRFHEL
jgi:hypothetical protein